MIRILVNGASGKMGTLACETLGEAPDFDLVMTLGRQDNLAQAIEESRADVVIDLTTAESVYANAKTIIASGARPVIGTSGLLADQIRELEGLCEEKQLGGIIVPNFSIGAVLMMSFAAKAAQLFSEVEIIEIHHQKKLDAPSGTAVKTADLIAKNRRKAKNSLALKELLPGVRGGEYQEVNIHSLRLPGVHARQQVLFGEQGETLSITHDCIDRSAYKPGILLACRQVMNLSHLGYGLESLLPL